uniref:RNA binding motif protein 34 n=1 Tax=Oncorhynchus mykiss TaxID=8022 RepID=A0A8K9XK73_ONCMY
MVQAHQDSREEGTTKPIPPQETEKIWHGFSDPQKVLQLHHREHPDAKSRSKRRQNKMLTLNGSIRGNMTHAFENFLLLLSFSRRKVHPKKQSINAYVVFEAEEGAEKALERYSNWQIEKNFHIRVDRVSKSSLHDHKRSIFIGNLPFDINELPVRQHFEECGKVEGVRLVRDKNSGMGKGFGYILFQSIDAVQLALKLDGLKLLGRSVRVKRSVKKEKEKKNVVSQREREIKGAGKEPTKGGFKERPGQGGPQNKSSGRPQGKGPQIKSMGKPFKKSLGEATKAPTGPSSFKR